MSDSDFNQDFVKSYDQMSVKYDNLLILGDLNYDLLSDQKSTPLTNVCDICDLENIVKCATCFTKGADPTLIDVILTNRKSLLQNVMNFSCGLSDVHNLIAVQIKSNTPSLKNPYKTYRSYKQFNYEAFIQDLDNAKLDDQIINDNKDIHKTYETFESSFLDVVNKHIPLKKRKSTHHPAPYMNQELRHAIFKKKMLFNKYNKIRSRDNWDKYRTQRNLVNKINRKSIREYFIERCVGGPKQNFFWPTIKPFITNKGSYFENNIILTDDDRIINDQNEVAETFNDFFVNVAKDIGKDSCAVNQEHPSVKVISEHKYSENKLKFESIDISFVEKQIDKMNINKATGKDGISVKILKIAKPIFSKPITMLINKTIENASFPNKLKEAQVVPLHKKNSQLGVGNYRPVSILPVVSKFFERAIYEQLSHYFENIFHPSLSAFRPGFGCNTALLKIIEDWKKTIDCNQYTAAVLMDLSKAFDCLPHDLLILKLEAYGLSKSALDLMHSYLSERKQCVKVGVDFSAWKNIYKGVPQGSILGPVLLKYF